MGLLSWLSMAVALSFTMKMAVAEPVDQTLYVSRHFVPACPSVATLEKADGTPSESWPQLNCQSLGADTPVIWRGETAKCSDTTSCSKVEAPNGLQEYVFTKYLSKQHYRDPFADKFIIKAHTVICESGSQLKEAYKAAAGGDAPWLKQLGCELTSEKYNVIKIEPEQFNDLSGHWKVRVMYKPGLGVTWYADGPENFEWPDGEDVFHSIN
jgi:hypothetical protein